MQDWPTQGEEVPAQASCVCTGTKTRALGVNEARSGREEHKDQDPEGLENVAATVVRNVLGEPEVSGPKWRIFVFPSSIVTRGNKCGTHKRQMSNSSCKKVDRKVRPRSTRMAACGHAAFF